MHFDNFTEEEKLYFKEKLGDLITVCNDDKIYIGQIEKTEDYIDLSTTCLPNVRF